MECTDDDAVDLPSMIQALLSDLEYDQKPWEQAIVLRDIEISLET